MREIRLSGSEGGVALIAPSLPLSHSFQLHRSGFRPLHRRHHWRSGTSKGSHGLRRFEAA